MEEAAVYLLKLGTDRAAALAASEEKVRKAMLIKAREEGFREAMEIFGLTGAPPDAKAGTEAPCRAKRRDIRQMIMKELSFSAKAMTKQQIAKAIEYTLEGTEVALKRLEREGTTQNRDAIGKLLLCLRLNRTGTPTSKVKLATHSRRTPSERLARTKSKGGTPGYRRVRRTSGRLYPAEHLPFQVRPDTA